MTRSALVIVLLAFAAAAASSVPCAAQALAPAPYATLNGDAGVTRLAFTADGEHLIAGRDDGRVEVWGLDSKQTVHVSRLPTEVVFVGALGDTGWVAVGRGGQSVTRSIGGEGEAPSTVADGRVLRGTLDAAGHHLAVMREDGDIELLRVADGAQLGTLDPGDRLDGDVVFIGFDRLGQQLAAVSNRGQALFWNPVTKRVLRQTTLSGGDLHGSRSKIHVIASRPEARVLAAGIEEVALPRGGLSGQTRPGDLVRRDVVVAYDWDRAMEVGRMEIADGEVAALAVGPGPDHVVVARRRRSDVKIIDLQAGRLAATVTLNAEPSALAVSDDDRWLAAGLLTGDIAVWSLASPSVAGTARMDQQLPALSGRIRVVGEKAPAMRPSSPATIAVLPFEGRGEAESRSPLVTETLTSDLANVESLTLVERLRIDALLEELRLLEEGITRSDGLEVGRMLQADYVILGSVEALESSFLLNARVLAVETSEVMSGRQVLCERCRTTDLVDAVRTLGAVLVDHGE